MTTARSPRVSLWMTVLVVLTVLLFSTFVIAGCSDEDTSGGDDGQTTEAQGGESEGSDSGTSGDVDAEAVLESSCALCHDLSRVYLASDATDWEDTIARMSEEHSKTQPGSDSLLTAEQEQAIIDFMKSRTISAGETVVREKCVECHDLTNITKQAQGTDWSSVIDRMVDEHDASLTEAEQQDALNFLRGE